MCHIRLILTAALIFGSALCYGQSEVGSFPNAAQLGGAERILADQSGNTVNLTPAQIGQYLGIPNGLVFPLSVANGGNGTATPSLVGGTNCTVTGSWPDQTISCSSTTTPAGGSGSIQWNNSGTLAGISFGAGQVLEGGSAPTATSALVLGASGTLGSITFGNTTSGTVTIAPPTGALGTLTLTLPLATSTFMVGSTTTTAGECALSTTTAGVYAPSTCPGGSPGGSSGYIQYNNAGVFGGIATTGSGNAVLANSPTLVTPALGTPSAVNLSNATNLPCTATPALTGDVTTAAGSCATTAKGWNGGTAPASAYFIYTNSNSQPVAGSLGGCLTFSSGTLSCPALFSAQSGTSYTVTTANNGEIIPLTNSAAKTLTVPIASTLGSGFSAVVINEGAGAATVSIASGTFAGGLSSFTMIDGSACEFDSDGSSIHLSACTALFSGTVSYTGTITATHCAEWSAAGVLEDSGSGCGGGGGGNAENVQVFTTSGTWTKPSGNPQNTDVICIGGGGGGGSGPVVASGTGASGGGGGGGGSTVEMLFPTSALTSTVTVTIATAASGGASVTSTGAGHGGTGGGNSAFGSYLTAYGGGGGGAGSSGASSQGGAGAGLISAASGITSGSVCSGTQTTGAAGGSSCGAGGGAGAGTTSAAAGNAGGNALVGGSGGGSGGGVTTTPTAESGGSSGAVGNATGVAGGTANSAGTAGTTGSGAYAAGTGGGGGGSAISGNAGAGGNAAVGGGGGGGGAAVSTGDSGAGGTGGIGECVATTTY